jgi:hypothetical protein
MLLALKGICLVVYALGLAAFAGLLPYGRCLGLQALAALFLSVHLLEMIFVFHHVRRYHGALWVSVLLTLLFGLLHWKPLADGEDH